MFCTRAGYDCAYFIFSICRYTELQKMIKSGVTEDRDFRKVWDEICVHRCQHNEAKEFAVQHFKNVERKRKALDGK